VDQPNTRDMRCPGCGGFGMVQGLAPTERDGKVVGYGWLFSCSDELRQYAVSVNATPLNEVVSA
jgi:hypothetical protein